MTFIVEKVLVNRQGLKSPEPIIFETNETKNQPTENLLCNMISRLIREMENDENDNNR